jgi:hypothetical protein
MARYVRVTWDRVVAVEDRLPIEELLVGVPGQKWKNIYGSGQVLRPETAAALEARWADRVGSQSAEAGWAIPVGAILSRRARGERYGGGLYGGIEPSATTANVFLYSDKSAGTAYGYNEGRKGNRSHGESSHGALNVAGRVYCRAERRS